MKQSLGLLLFLLMGFQPLSATDIGHDDFLAWNVIRERLFNGENTKAFRFEDNIRFQVIGAETQQDSAVFVQLVDELKGLLETVEVTLVDKNPNFTLTVSQHQGGKSTSTMCMTSGYAISTVMLTLGFPGSYSDEVSVKQLYYHIFRHLTKLYTPEHGSTYYGGIFDAAKAEESILTDTDKAVLHLLYSKEFYKNLRTVTVATRGHLYYWEMRYKKPLKALSYGFKALLLLLDSCFFSRVNRREGRIPPWANTSNNGHSFCCCCPFSLPF